MKATELTESIGKPVQVAYLDPTFGSDRTLTGGVLIGRDEDAENPLAIVQMANGRSLRVDPAYVLPVLPPLGSKRRG